MVTPRNPDDVSAIPPPEGMTSNFDSPESMYPPILGAGITSLFIMAFAVGIRMYTKAVIMKNLKHEDFVALAALAGFISWYALTFHFGAIGYTRDLWNIRALDMPHLLYSFNVISMLYLPSMGAAKYFICVQLKRIFCPGSYRDGVWWSLQILTSVIIAIYVACFFVFLFECVPREKIWKPTIQGKCINYPAVVLSGGTVNLVLDLAILCLPAWAIGHLHLPLKRKLGAMTVFGVGIFTCALAAYGITIRIAMLNNPNQTNQAAKLICWSYAEFTGTMVVGCMPMFPRFYEHFTGSCMRSRSTRDTALSRTAEENMSTRQIVVTSEFTREDVQDDLNFIELTAGFGKISR